MISTLRERAGRNIVLGLMAIVTLYPIIGIISTALEPLHDATAGVSFWHSLSWSSMAYAWSVGHFDRYLVNTFIVCAAVVVSSVVVSVFCAYGLAVLRPAGCRWVLYLAILAFLLPTESLIVPWYYQLRGEGLVNTYWAMILPQMAQSVGFGVFWVRTAVLGVPKSLIEAGRLDGASEWSLLYRVIVPSIYPAIKTMAALVFLWTWNSFLLPLVMLSTPSLYVVTIGLETFQGAHFSNYAALAAASVIAALPVLIVYLFAQRSFISGMFAGAVVE